ncbi:hypothetical protein Q7P35_009027 [Cladosporium inversicolor]
MESQRWSIAKATSSSRSLDDNDECIFEFDEERRSHQRPSPIFHVSSTRRSIKPKSAQVKQRKPKDSTSCDMITKTTKTAGK